MKMNQLVGKKDDGCPFLLLILEPGNLHRLQQHDPIVLRVQDLFPEGIPKRLELSLGYSETPVADSRALAKMAVQTFDERTPRHRAMRPHCPECRSTIEQLGVWRSDQAPVDTVFCAACGCVLSVVLKPKEAHGPTA
jgi:Zn ribbon nucleic-acid-binding protein